MTQAIYGLCNSTHTSLKSTSRTTDISMRMWIIVCSLRRWMKTIPCFRPMQTAERTKKRCCRWCRWKSNQPLSSLNATYVILYGQPKKHDLSICEKGTKRLRSQSAKHFMSLSRPKGKELAVGRISANSNPDEV